MRDDSVSTRDRYAQAVCADDLTPYRESSLAPLDVIAAAGMAAQRARLGMALQRLRAGSLADRRTVEAALAARLLQAVRCRQVRRDGCAVELVAHEALAWWLDPVCRECSGVRMLVATGSNRLTGKACAVCRGTGLRPVEASAPNAARWVIDFLQGQVERSEGAHRARLR